MEFWIGFIVGVIVVALVYKWLEHQAFKSFWGW